MRESIGKLFMERTAPQHLEPSRQSQGVPQPALELPYPPQAALIDLPSPDSLPIPALDLRLAIEQRRTLRHYQETPLTLDELSYLLWATQGVQNVTNRPVTFRTVPSAGARHAFETFLLLNRVADVPPGLYRYIALEHALLPVSSGPALVDSLVHACWDQEQVRRSAATFFWAAVLERMYWRYGERGYRYLLLDAGHVCQNLYLAAESVGCGVCAIAAYQDDLLNPALGLDGQEQFTVYAASLGKR